jgi:protein-disulfide isomerase
MRRYTRLYLTILLMVASSFAQQSAKPAAKPANPAKSADVAKPAAGALTEATVDSFLRRMFGYDPNISWKVVKIEKAQDPALTEVTAALKNPEGQQLVKFYVTPDAKYAVAGEMMPFGADPFAPARTQLDAKAHGPARGPATAKVTIVEFSDLQCPSCKAAQPTIDRLLTDVPDARFVFQNFPLEQLHPWAFKAAAFADCLGRANNAAFWKFLNTVYENQEKVTSENADSQLKAFAAESGGDPQAVAACAAQPATAAQVRESLALGKALDVTGTPTLFINGRKIGNVAGIPYDLLKAIAQNTPK